MARHDDSAATSNETTMILSIRLIRSFEHRNFRHMILRGIDASGQLTGHALKQLILTMLPNEKLPPPFKTYAFDTLKIEHYPHQSKSNDLVIRRDGDERLMIDDLKHLSDYNIVDGTEIAFFKYSDYELYKQNTDLVMD